MSARPTVARVDLGALAHNYRVLVDFVTGTPGDMGVSVGDAARPAAPAVSLSPVSRDSGSTTRPRAPRVIGVVKANAYGHGAAPVALALEAAGAPMLACADIEEGVLLRRAGVRVPVLVFGALSIGDVDGLFEHTLTPTVSTPSAAKALEQAAARRGVILGCHLKIDTGMNRLGFRHDQLDRTMPPLLASPHLSIDAVYTHFATADNPDDALFGEQRTRFDRAWEKLLALGLDERASDRAASGAAVEKGVGATADRAAGRRPAAGRAPVWRHAANSAALLRDERTWFDAVRPGLLLYGLVPPPLATTAPLRPVMTLTSRITAVKGIRPGEGVSYGLRFRADGPRRLAVVPAGYADGLDTRLGNQGFVLVRGRRAPIVGAVCMDMLMIDVTDQDADPGDEVVILGEQGDERIDAREMAAAIGSIPWEILCRIGTRIERVYTSSSAEAAGGGPVHRSSSGDAASGEAVHVSSAASGEATRGERVRISPSPSGEGAGGEGALRP